MFTIDTKRTNLPIREKKVLKILFSMNIHQVATPEMVLEEARSYVVFFKERAGTLTAHIAIHLLATNRTLYYTHSSNPFSEENLNTVEDDARSFAESLGAMLDEKDFETMSVADQDSWLDKQDIFAIKSSQQKQTAETASEVEKTPIAQVQNQQPATPVQPTAPVPEPEQPAVFEAPDPLPPQRTIIQQPNPSWPSMTASEQFPSSQTVRAPKQPARRQSPSAHAPVSFHQEIFAPPPQATTRKNSTPSRLTPQRIQQLTAKGHHEIMQQAIKKGIARASKKPQINDSQPPSGMVSRDREALARLLTSF
ncbi:MAG: hypothetical protein WC539_00905 [Nitrospirota bacterium]